MQYQSCFPIYRNASALVIAIEEAVRQFPRYHKYTLGAELRTTVYDLLTAITYSINNKSTHKQTIKKAHNFSEVLKIKIHIAKNVTNISFKVFENLASLVIEISKQSKAWHNKCNAMRQNDNNYA